MSDYLLKFTHRVEVRLSKLELAHTELKWLRNIIGKFESHRLTEAVLKGCSIASLRSSVFKDINLGVKSRKISNVILLEISR